MDRFQELLWDLGEIIELPLHIDKNHACKLLLNEQLEIQLEMDPEGEQLLMTSFIAELPPGKFRENVLYEALKVNASVEPSSIFAYLEKTNTLALYQYLPAEHLTAEALITHLDPFIEEAEEWRQALSNSASAPSKYLSQTTLPPHPFIK